MYILISPPPDGQRVRPPRVREADVGDEGADPEPDPGPEGWQEPRATGADAGCHCREVGFRLYMANESYRKFLVTLSAVTSRAVSYDIYSSCDWLSARLLRIYVQLVQMPAVIVARWVFFCIWHKWKLPQVPSIT